jgi:dihydroneopterin aldolase
MHACVGQENRLGQKFVVDAVLQCDLERAGLTDELDHTVNYAAVYKCAGLRLCSATQCPIRKMAKGILGAASACCARANSPGGALPIACAHAMFAASAGMLSGWCGAQQAKRGGHGRRDIQQVMEGPPHKLLESVAEDIAAGILEEYALVSGVRILIKKPHVAVGGVVKYLGARARMPFIADPCMQG